MGGQKTKYHIYNIYIYDIYLQIHKHMKGYELSRGCRVRVDKKGDVCLPYDVPTLHYSNP